MSQRDYSVIVVPEAWSDSLEGLARLVAPMTSVRPQQLVPVLRRGPMTLDADLSRDEADRLFERLASLDVPSRIVDGDDAVVREVERTEVASPENLTDDETPAEAADSAEPAAGEAAETDEGWDSFLGDAEVEDIEVPDSSESPVEWGGIEVDAAVDAESRDAAGARGSTTPENEKEKKKSRERSGTQLGAPGPSGSFGAESAKHNEDPGDEERFGPPSTDDEPAPPEPTTPEPTTPRKAKDAPPQIPSRGVEGEEKESTKPARTSREPKPAAPIGSMAESGFDAGRMNAALETDSERPPYAPDGFDDRGEHIPALAAFLSVVAPGAGQTYNGEAEKSWDFGARFALLVPWYKSVRQAWDRAEQIRTYYAPRPSEGAFARALKYAASWWIIVGGIVAILGFGGTAAYNALSRPERPKITEADIRSAHDEARRQVMLARIGGLDGVSRHLDERDQAQQRFTMSDDERVERLFRRGYESCRAREYSTCEAVMKRVSSLSPKYRREAYKLQAWASMQGSPDSQNAPMPTIEVDSLEAFETTGPDSGSAQEDPSESNDEPVEDTDESEDAAETDAGEQAPENPPPDDGDETP